MVHLGKSQVRKFLKVQIRGLSTLIKPISEVLQSHKYLVLRKWHYSDISHLGKLGVRGSRIHVYHFDFVFHDIALAERMLFIELNHSLL